MITLTHLPRDGVRRANRQRRSVTAASTNRLAYEAQTSPRLSGDLDLLAGEAAVHPKGGNIPKSWHFLLQSSFADWVTEGLA